MELLGAGQMRAAEQHAMARGQASGAELMERAGRGVVDALLARRPAFAHAPHRALVLCGPGNNGGDGLVVARLLRARGWQVEVRLWGDPARLPPDAATNLARWGEAAPWRRPEIAASMACGVDLVVDALFGTGLSRGLPADMAGIRDAIDRSGAFRLAVDLPSGICSDSGRDLGHALAADLTVSFHRPRIGHYLLPGATLCGALAIVDIGLGPDGVAPETVVRLAEATPEAVLKGQGHKYEHGHVLVLSGPASHGGAARLAARGALRMGAGLVTIGAPGDALPEHAARLDAVMLRGIGDAAALATALEDPRLDTLLLGPGLGVERASGLARVALAAGRATVLDADALSCWADRPEALFDLLHENVVLTPHMGEFARLFPDITASLAAPPGRGPAFSKVDAVTAAARRAGCTVLLKGPDTVIADRTGATRIAAALYERSVPWLATAGAGDVLAGFIAGLLARGLPPIAAAASAAVLHADCARAFGPGLIAEDLPDALPRVLAAVSHGARALRE
ncbi:NAD(P)H-hydrate dehydratase [Halovulum dunhuangense]|uniref:Bifunctional NAD(P)H-hydrate repair enzyme n=1 Tax=Halovulum dunhuangense TaxID=1505036 RepID=A0A849L307_9RHOB|nr:NAD(P)H-hydrate dehydratase [Halovulum dunhuangense]NNU80675.1 NAD(P)H-hydrate dehydratase [Halovulum dunhuangense]